MFLANRKIKTTVTKPYKMAKIVGIKLVSATTADGLLFIKLGIIVFFSGD
jgi:hypothetical protein